METDPAVIQTLEAIVSGMKGQTEAAKSIMEAVKALAELVNLLDGELKALTLRVEVIESGIEKAVLDAEMDNSYHEEY